jgi:hypothetical protein
MEGSGHTTGTASGSESNAPDGSMKSAVDTLMSLMGPEEDKPESEEHEATEETSEGEEQSESELESAIEDLATEADEATEEESEVESEEEGETHEESDQHFTVKVDGKEERVKLDELLAGYSRTADYTRKTQALSTERKSLEEELSKARAERAEYAQYLPHVRKLIEGTEAEPKWDELKAKDPAQWAIKREEWRERREKLAAVDAEQKRLSDIAKGEQDKHRAKILTEQKAELMKRLPAWKDPKVAKAQAKEVGEWMKKVGFSDQELAVYDARALHALWKAKEYDRIMAQQPKLREKLGKVPTVKPSNLRVKPKTSIQQARDRLVKSGGAQKAAASLIEKLL